MDIYDRGGRPISMAEWGQLHSDLDYRRVGFDEIGPYQVSTVWLGMDHSYYGGEILIFETMVFGGDYSDLDCVRYSCLHDAILGHYEMVEQVKDPNWQGASWEPSSSPSS